MRNSVVQKIVPHYDFSNNLRMSLYNSYNSGPRMFNSEHRGKVVSERFLRKDLLYRNRSDTKKVGIVIRKKMVPPEKW